MSISWKIPFAIILMTSFCIANIPFKCVIADSSMVTINVERTIDIGGEQSPDILFVGNETLSKYPFLKDALESEDQKRKNYKYDEGSTTCSNGSCTVIERSLPPIVTATVSIYTAEVMISVPIFG